MEWYQKWMEFETELSAEELKHRLNDPEFLSGYACTAKLLSNDRFTIASTEGSHIQEQFVFSGNIRKQEQGVSVVGTFGWSGTSYAVIGAVVAVFFVMLVAMWASTGNFVAGLVCAVVVFVFMALLFGIGYVWDALTKNRSQVTWKDVHANTVLFFIRRGLLPNTPKGRFITVDDLHR